MLIRIAPDVPLYAGDYPVDPPYTNREVHVLSKQGETLPVDLVDNLMKGKVEVVIALAIIGLRRKGLTIVEDVLWDAELGKVTLVADEAEQAASLPPQMPSSSDSARNDEPNGSSGTPGNDAGASHQASSLSSTGSPA